MIPVFLPDVKIAIETVLAKNDKEAACHFNYYNARSATKFWHPGYLAYLTSFIDSIVQLEGERLDSRPLGPIIRMLRSQSI